MDGSSRASAEEVTERSLLLRATATRWRRVALAVGTALIVGAVVTLVLIMSTPRADAVLKPIPREPDAEIGDFIDASAWFEIDSSTLYAYEPYRGWELWSALNEYGSACLFVLPPTREDIRWSCTPAPGEPLVDTYSFHLREGAIIRFEMNSDAVIAYVHPDAEAP